MTRRLPRRGEGYPLGPGLPERTVLSSILLLLLLLLTTLSFAPTMTRDRSGPLPSAAASPIASSASPAPVSVGSGDMPGSHPGTSTHLPPSSPSVQRSAVSASITTTDPGVAKNRGIETNILIPNGSLVAGQNFTFLVGEPFNATTQIAVGLFGFQDSTVADWEAGYAIWNLTSGSGVQEFVNRSRNFTSGSTVVLAFSFEHGTWWSATADGLAIEAAGGNGTVDLGASSAVGFSPATSPFTSPSLLVVSPVAGPPVTVLFDPAFALLSVGGRIGGPMVPNNGIWRGPSTGWQVVGDDQAPGLLDGEIELGGSVAPAPPTGDWLWGLAGPGFHTVANVTGSLSGSFPNSGIGAVLNLSSGIVVGPNATSYVVTAWENVAPGLSLGVGAWVNAPGARVVPFFVENLSGSLDATLSFTHPSLAKVLRLEGTSTVNLTTGVPTGWWNFSLNGRPITGSTDNANGSLPVGVQTVTSGPRAYLTVQVAGPLPATLSPLSLDAALLLNESGAWTLPHAGSVGPLANGCLPCAGSPEEGYLQDLFLAPGAVEVSSGLPSLSPATELWNGSGFPRAQVAATGLAGQLGSLSTWPVHVWVNGSGVPLTPPQVEFVLPAGLHAGLPWYLPGGGAIVNLSLPLAPSPQQLTFSVLGSAMGWLPGSVNLSVWLVPGNLSVEGHLDGPPLYSDGQGTVILWVNGTEGAGPLPNATLSFQSPLGGVLGAPVFDSPVSAYTVPYTAPLVELPENDSLAILAVVAGFQVGGGHAVLAIQPYTLALAVRAVNGPLVSGGLGRFVAWVNSTTGTPLAGATLSAVFGYAPLPASVPSTVSGPGAYAFDLTVPLLSANSSALLVAEASVLGYGVGLAEVRVPVVLQALDLSVQVGPWSGGSVTVSLATSNASGPVVGAYATLIAPSGSVLPPAVFTDLNGQGAFTWTPPSGSQGTVLLHLTVSAQGFYSRSSTVSVTVPSSSGPLGVSRADWLLAAPLAVIACFLALWAYARWRAGPPRPSLITSPKGVPPETPEAAEGKGEEKETPTFLPKDSLGLPPPETATAAKEAPAEDGKAEPTEDENAPAKDEAGAGRSGSGGDDPTP